MVGSTLVQLSDDSDNAFSDDDSELERMLNETEEIQKVEQTVQEASVQINPPTHHRLAYNELTKYIYPINFELRDYQYNIVRRAFYDNVLVALPTGLGKTFIASTVMLNYGRWFPESKLIFMAPTRPLVAQQLKACCSIAGVPASKVAILLDKSRKFRQEIWDSKLVFFTTPQVVENDLASGLLHPKSVALLIIDEAHRAKGNYAYNNVVKFLNRFNNSYRIIALTATPASDIEGVQDVIDNLAISKVEVRTENSIDIIKYMKRKKLIRRNIPTSDNIQTCIGYISEAIAPVLKLANDRKILEITSPLKINFFQCMEASRRISMNRSIPNGLKWSNVHILQLLGVVGQALRKLNTYGIKSFQSYITEKHLEFTTKNKAKKSKSKISTDFYLHPAITTLLDEMESMMKEERFSHPKMATLMEELEEFFALNNNPDSKVIIFTELRESALEIVNVIEKCASDATVSVISSLKPHIFIGQSKEKDRFDESKYLAKTKSKKLKAALEEEEEEEEEEASFNIHEHGTVGRLSVRTSSENAQTNGMNQKLQKKIISDFKSGVFNILVATSIGEEGLDIGEVDLIVCYDSTASPIKNIQRMGRTGRKREGKVVLLFSGNEEAKFDKAMGGYDYIQLHIMKGDLITLAERNRILPTEFEPEVVQQLIEIPEENIKLNEVEDEDEIIKIATQYMLSTTKAGAGTKSKPDAQKKKGKRFFMPDNVETNFRSVKSMLQEATKSQQLTQSSNLKNESSQEKSILDSIVDSSDDDEDDLSNLTNANISRISNLSHEQEPSLPLPSNKLAEVTPTKTTATDTSFQHFNSSEVKKRSFDDSTTDTTVKVSTKKKSLGVKRPKFASVKITDLLRGCQPKRKNTSSEVILIDDDAIIDIPDYTPNINMNVEVNKIENKTDPKMTETQKDENNLKKVVGKIDKHTIDDEKNDGNKSIDTIDLDEELFDDGLDEELALLSTDAADLLSEKNRSSFNETSSYNVKETGVNSSFHESNDYMTNMKQDTQDPRNREQRGQGELRREEEQGSTEEIKGEKRGHNKKDLSDSVNNLNVNRGDSEEDLELVSDSDLEQELPLSFLTQIYRSPKHEANHVTVEEAGYQPIMNTQKDGENEILYTNNFANGRGLLNDEQKMELYTSYYLKITPDNEYDPFESLIGCQSKTSKRYKQFLEREMSEVEAANLIESYKSMKPMNKCSIELLNSDAE